MHTYSRKGPSPQLYLSVCDVLFLGRSKDLQRSDFGLGTVKR